MMNARDFAGEREHLARRSRHPAANTLRIFARQDAGRYELEARAPQTS
jgi:hypothetical protein